MRNCLFLTMEDARYGFDLTGFYQVVTDSEHVLGELEKYIKATEHGLIIVDERLLDEKTMGRIQVLEKWWGGTMITLPLPAREEMREEQDYGQRLIARVLGYQMKLT